jgi:hypothetical protein
MTEADQTQAGNGMTKSSHRGDSSSEALRLRKTREGLVVSDKMDKTVVVAVEDRVQHALYKKYAAPHEQAQGARRAEQLRRRRPGPAHGDPAAVGHQALARREILERPSSANVGA